MSGELFWLALTVALSLVMWIPYASLYRGIGGLKAATTDLPPTPELPDWAKRCHRAHMNLIENLIPFAILILMLNVGGKADGATPSAAAVFFFARLAHAVIYPLGIPYLRTPAFATGWLVCLYLLWQALA